MLSLLLLPLICLSHCGSAFKLITYDDIKAMFPQILQRTPDNLQIQRVIEQQIGEEPSRFRDISIAFKDCEPSIFDTKFLTEITQMTAQKCRIAFQAHSKAIAAIPSCAQAHVPQRAVFYFVEELCSKVPTEHIRDLQTQRKGIIDKLLKESVFNTLYPAYVDGISEWFKAALEWMESNQPQFQIFTIDLNFGLSRFKSYLHQYHKNEYESHKILPRTHVLDEIIDQILRRYDENKAKQFRYDQILPQYDDDKSMPMRLEPKPEGRAKSAAETSEREPLFTYTDIKEMFPTILEVEHVESDVYNAIKDAILKRKRRTVRRMHRSRDRGRRRKHRSVYAQEVELEDSSEDEDETSAEDRLKVKAAYPKWKAAISKWFQGALDWISTQDLPIRQITKPGGKMAFELKFKEFLSIESREEVDVHLIGCILDNIIKDRLDTFYEYDRLIMYKAPTNDYNFDTLRKKGDGLSAADVKINRKLERMMLLFERQDESPGMYARWETMFLYELYVAKGYPSDSIDGEAFIAWKDGPGGKGAYCALDPSRVLGSWANCADLIAIKLYTDDDDFQRSFSKSFWCDLGDVDNCDPYKWIAWKVQLERVFAKDTKQRKELNDGQMPDVYPPMYHGMTNRCFDPDQLLSFKFNGPLSTSLDPVIAISFAGYGTIFTIEIAEGNRFCPLNVAGLSHYRDEQEITLYNANVKMRIKRDMRSDVIKEMCALKLRDETPPKYNKKSLTVDYDHAQMKAELTRKGYKKYLISYVLKMNEWNQAAAERDAKMVQTRMVQFETNCDACRKLKYSAKVRLLYSSKGKGGGIEAVQQSVMIDHLHHTKKYSKELCKWSLTHHKWNEKKADDDIDNANELMVELADIHCKSIAIEMTVTQQMNLLKKYKWHVSNAASDPIFQRLCLWSEGYNKILTQFVLDRDTERKRKWSMAQLMDDAQNLKELTDELETKYCDSMDKTKTLEIRLKLLQHHTWEPSKVASDARFKRLCLETNERRLDENIIDFVLTKHKEWNTKQLLQNAQDISELLQTLTKTCESEACVKLNVKQKLEALETAKWHVANAITAIQESKARSEMWNYYDYYDYGEYYMHRLKRKYRLINKLLNKMNA